MPRAGTAEPLRFWVPLVYTRVLDQGSHVLVVMAALLCPCALHAQGYG